MYVLHTATKQLFPASDFNLKKTKGASLKKMLANFYFYLAMFFIVSFNFGKVSNVDELKEKTTIFLSLDSLYIY